jgi:tRNA U34 5-carboxymethylaminomethyl modifying GTPase MnmE/TrmE
MNNQELLELLNGVERLKSNISECESVIKVLREIQKNYENAVSKPTELIEKLDALVVSIEKNHLEVCSKSKEVTDGLNDSKQNLEDKTKMILQEIKEEIASFIDGDRKLHSEVLALSEAHINKLSEIKDSLQESLINMVNKVDIMTKDVVKTKKLTLFSLCVGAFASLMTVILLILSLV